MKAQDQASERRASQMGQFRVIDVNDAQDPVLCAGVINDEAEPIRPESAWLVFGLNDKCDLKETRAGLKTPVGLGAVNISVIAQKAVIGGEESVPRLTRQSFDVTEILADVWVRFQRVAHGETSSSQCEVR
jgi:hypothetical protein